jgi:hypothetical protein
MKTSVSFPSDGDRISADLYLPEHLEAPVPAVVLGGGWCYVKELVQPTFAEAISDKGMASLVFDYRGFGESGGAPRQHINPWAQMEDYKNAISYVMSRDEVDSARIGIWGISYSGGHVIQLAATDARVKSSASVVPVIDGYQNLRLAHGTAGFRRLIAAVGEDREKRWSGEEGGTLFHNPQEPGGLATWPFPTSADMFRELKATDAPNYQGFATTVSTEWLLEYDVRSFAARILDTAILFVLAEGDDHTHWDLAMEAFRSVPAPERHLEVIRESTHQTIYRDQSRRSEAAAICAEWFEATL